MVTQCIYITSPSVESEINSITAGPLVEYFDSNKYPRKTMYNSLTLFHINCINKKG